MRKALVLLRLKLQNYKKKKIIFILTLTLLELYSSEAVLFLLFARSAAFRCVAYRFRGQNIFELKRGGPAVVSRSFKSAL